MNEREGKPPHEQEIKPISIQLTTKREQEIMLELADSALFANTIKEVRGGGGQDLKVENNIWRTIFRQCAINLGIKHEPGELLMRGIICDVSIQTLEQWARGKDQQSPGEKPAITSYAKYFLKQKRQSVEKGLR